MRKVKLYIATSLDGKIALQDGSIDWLENIETPNKDRRYNDFMKTVDTVILGSKTYLQVIEQLSPDNYPYQDKTSIVMTSRDLPLKEGVKLENRPITEVVRELRELEGEDIWIVGGATLVTPLVAENLIDEYIITLIPVVLGEGISLFEKQKVPLWLKYSSVTQINGLVCVTYLLEKE